MLLRVKRITNFVFFLYFSHKSVTCKRNAGSRNKRMSYTYKYIRVINVYALVHVKYYNCICGHKNFLHQPDKLIWKYVNIAEIDRFTCRWSDSGDRQRPPLLGELNGNRSPRKSTDRIPRTIKCRQEETLHRQNGHTDKLPAESPSNKKTMKPKDTKSSESNDKEQHDIKREENPVKSCIPTARKPATSTLIPRSARTLTSTSRPHNT